MNVLSLFDGMSCGRIALERSGVEITNYYASEIDKYAMAISNKNYPDIIQLGNVTSWPDWNLPQIDLLIGGSPCQGFSRAGKRLNFDDPRSKLFFEYLSALQKFKPKYFLLENVKMKQADQDTISEYLGVQPILINSANVSAQNRERLYWTNIPGIIQPEDKGILLKDVIEDEYIIGGAMRGRYDENGKVKQQFEIRKDGKSNSLTTVQKDTLCFQVGIASEINGHDILKRVYSIEGKSPTLNTMNGGNRQPKIQVNTDQWRKLTPLECERLQTVPDNYTEGVSNTQRYKMLGNGWTVDVISHIFNQIPIEVKA